MSVQAKDVPADELLKVVATLDKGIGVDRTLLKDHFQQFPEKVVYAKANRLVRQGRLDGCTDGCGGWYSIPASRYRLALDDSNDA